MSGTARWASLPALPALEAVPALRAALADPGLAVLAAPPGSGKTTVVPLALLESPWLEGRRILILEPRRLAARAAAARMASLLGERAGQTVGYQVRFDRKISAGTRIEVITEGVLTRRLQADPELPEVGLILFDEFHERSLDADLALALSLEAREQLRPDLRLLVMSATLDTQRVAALLGGAPVVEAAGRMFPVSVEYRPGRVDESVEAAVARGTLEALATQEGDVLGFLPGGREIRACARMLEARLPAAVDVWPLYGELSAEDQDAALRPAAAGRRKVILATNIAQTSLTVEGVRSVVDGGLARVARHDLGAGANRLLTERISKASADQRAGRAGRLSAGVCYRMWSSEQQGRMAAHDTPEMQSVDLTRFALELAAWGHATPDSLRLLDAPPAIAWNAARALLADLGAVDAAGRLTAHGRALVRLPAEPRRAHMLLAAKTLDLGACAAWTAAALDERDATRAIDLAPLVRDLARGAAGDPGLRARVRESARQLMRIADIEDAPFDEDEVGRAVALAYPERIARRREGGQGLYLCADGGEARLPEQDVLAQQEWLAIAHWEPGSPRRVRAAARLREAQLRADAAERLEWRRVVRWDRTSGVVLAEEQRALGALVLERRVLRDAGEATRSAMLEGLRDLGLEALPWTEAAQQLRARISSLHQWRPDEPWQALDDAALLANLDQWLGPQLQGITRRDHLARLDLVSILQAPLDYAAQTRLNRLAPTHLEVPSGSRVALEYALDGAAPVLSVKLQELFGLQRTPTVNEGRTPVMLHLLSPARRPIQVTQDLAGFWARTYPEVKKELKGRYPRHPWPDDPLAAPPTARAKPRGT